LRHPGLKSWVISRLDLAEGVAKRADFRRQVSEIRQHVSRRQMTFDNRPSVGIRGSISHQQLVALFRGKLAMSATDR
jgi:hypothetical protein